ncbi:hypothetical protein K7X08_032602 [Anisodus acutangulus]|uniref:Uncharacterized protein n=1 Tax=Anisodus acutangulus TaxID=402998 RepID=A0A9Q1RRB3_9SOLA|nr:hypothetical protein K7X08_032602 [Anisodus acutangulus]
MQIGHLCPAEPIPQKGVMKRPGKQAWKKPEGVHGVQNKEKRGKRAVVKTNTAGTQQNLPAEPTTGTAQDTGHAEKSTSDWQTAKGGSPAKVKPPNHELAITNGFNPLTVGSF